MPAIRNAAAHGFTDYLRLLWHGNTFRAGQVLSWLQDDLYVDDEAEDPPEVQVKLARHVSEFATYFRANAHLIPNYGERHRCGEAISSAPAANPGW